MINLENLAAFVLGMVVVYLMFRSMGVFVFVLVLGVWHGTAQAQDVNVTNWPTTNAPLPVQMTSESTGDVWPAAASGMAFGFTCCGFGWILRTSKKVAPNEF